LVVDSYGKRTLSGQMEEADLAVLAAAGVDAPAVFAADLMYFSPSMAERQPPPKELPETVLRMAETGHVISLLWHGTRRMDWWTTVITPVARVLHRRQHLYHRLTHHHRLNHLLWCVTIEDPAWHPGDYLVDVVCIDVYPEDRGDLLTGVWSGLRATFDGRKPIALGDFPGVPDIPRMRGMGVHWAWFCSWRGPHGPRLNSADEIRRVFESPEVITLRDLPAHRR